MSLYDLENARVRVCFNCREYHLINVSDYKSIQSLNYFEKRHRGHRTQVVNFEELANIYPVFQQC